jgi:hypothetical protein
MMLDDDDPIDENTEVRHQRTAEAKVALDSAQIATIHTDEVVAESIGLVTMIRAIRQENHLTQKWRSIIQGYGQGAA